ncbi:MAG: hypothetical protein HYU67_07080 [Flavobacteriia bacterium]|nr:hypothetical protein [Flavobacteriia bacterium]
MNEILRIGLIQPVIDPDKSWGKGPYNINIDPVTASRVWQEIKSGISLLLKDSNKPDVILIPELHLPIDKISLIKSISLRNNVVIIAGTDFYKDPLFNRVRNRGVITIPNNWGSRLISSRLKSLMFGKTYFTYMEKGMFNNLALNKCVEDPEQNMYIFKSGKFGNFGIMICSDIFDIERMLLYQTRIHHLFIISLNKDLTTYFHMAESLARLLYCNIVICNTGFYGGSVVISPFDTPQDRLIYKYQGQKMFNIHSVSVPIKSLDNAQNFDFSKYNKKKNGIKFKASPPGYFDKKSRLNEID